MDARGGEVFVVFHFRGDGFVGVGAVGEVDYFLGVAEAAFLEGGGGGEGEEGEGEGEGGEMHCGC